MKMKMMVHKNDDRRLLAIECIWSDCVGISRSEEVDLPLAWKLNIDF